MLESRSKSSHLGCCVECLDKIIIDLNAKKKYTNIMEIELKNQVKFKEWNVRGYGGYIIKMFKRYIFVVLENDLYNKDVDVGLVKVKLDNVEHVTPFVGKIKGVMKNYIMTHHGM